MKIHRRGNIKILAICDEDILGKTFREGRMKIEIKEEFYGERKIPLNDIFELIEDADIVNMVGKRVIYEAIKRGYIPQEGIIEVAGIPHVQIVKL